MRVTENQDKKDNGYTNDAVALFSAARNPVICPVI